MSSDNYRHSKYYYDNDRNLPNSDYYDGSEINQLKNDAFKAGENQMKERIISEIKELCDQATCRGKINMLAQVIKKVRDIDVR